MENGDVAYYEAPGGGTTTVMIHSIWNGLADVSEVGGDEDAIFEVDLDRLTGPI